MKLYHYTDLVSVLGIIKPERALEFWGSRYDCMNDPLDYQFAKNRIMGPMIEASIQQNMKGDTVLPIDVHPFIVSFSKKADDFLMWRMYHAKVCLVLDSEYFNRQTPNSALIECEYMADTQEAMHSAFSKVDTKIHYCKNIYANVSRISTYIKHIAFETEGEVRLASWDYYNKTGDKLCLQDCEEDKNNIVTEGFFSRVNANGKIILFKKFAIDGNALSGIIVHTYSEIEFNSIKDALRSVLIQNGFSSDVFENIQQTSAYPINL